MTIDKEVLLRFIADYKLPIQVVEEPYFSYYLELYDKDYDTKKKYQLLLDTLKQFETQQAFLDYYYETRDTIVKTLKLSDAYKHYTDDKNNDFVPVNKNPATYLPLATVRGVNFSKRTDVYTLDNVGKYFLSIDLRKANFQVLNKYDKRILLGANSYEEFMGKFTDLEYIKESKYFREVIFGSINVGRQIQMERYYTGTIIEWLVDNEIFTSEEIKIYTNDELVISLNKHMSPEECEKLRNRIKDDLKLDVTVESFLLHSISGKKYFVKELSTGGIKFKSIPAAYFAQVYKKYYGLKIEHNALIFYYEHNLATFEKPIF